MKSYSIFSNSINLLLPTKILVSSNSALIPYPEISSYFLIDSLITFCPFFSYSSTTDFAIGWFEKLSTSATYSNNFSFDILLFLTFISTTLNVPLVIVPVLSIITVSTLSNASK